MSRTRRWVVPAVAALAIATAASAHARTVRRRHKRVPGPARPAWLEATPPAGWSELAPLARSVATALRQSALLGDRAARVGAQAFVARGAGAFYVSWLESDRPAEAPDQVVRAALDRLRGGRLVSNPEAHSTEELRYDEGLHAGVAEAELEWRHLSNETLSLVRAFAWLSGDGKPRLAAAECVVSTTGGKPPPPVEKACRDALASVAVNIPAAEVTALGILPASRTATGPDQVAPGKEMEAAPQVAPRLPTAGAVASGAEDRVLYRGAQPEESRHGMSPWLIAIGAALILLASWLTVRRRLRADAGAARFHVDATSISPDEHDP